MDTNIALLIIAVSSASLLAGMYIAREKNRSTTEGALFGLLLGPIGLIIEALLPTQIANLRPPRLGDRPISHCGQCRRIVPIESMIDGTCPTCRQRFTDAAPDTGSDASQIASR